MYKIISTKLPRASELMDLGGEPTTVMLLTNVAPVASYISVLIPTDEHTSLPSSRKLLN